MTMNESAPNVPTPIDPASQIALAVLADYFNEKHANRAAFAEQCREDDPDAYPEQMAIADTWRRAANVVSAIAHGRPGGPETSWKLTIKIGASELGKLIAMATASNPERIDELEAESTQLQEATDAMHAVWPDDTEHRGSLAEWIEAFAARSPANECSHAERTQYELTIEQQKAKSTELRTNNDVLLGTIETFNECALVDKKRIAELEARIDELTRVPVVDGQTPGQLAKATFMRVTYNHHESEGVDRWARVANEVLRVFGNGAAALQRVRDALDANDVSVGEELAALAPAKSPTTP